VFDCRWRSILPVRAKLCLARGRGIARGLAGVGLLEDSSPTPVSVKDIEEKFVGSKLSRWIVRVFARDVNTLGETATFRGEQLTRVTISRQYTASYHKINNPTYSVWEANDTTHKFVKCTTVLYNKSHLLINCE
jgi:hypothetical protein